MIVKHDCFNCDKEINIKIEDISIIENERSDGVLEDCFSTTCPHCEEWTQLIEFTNKQEEEIKKALES